MEERSREKRNEKELREKESVEERREGSREGGRESKGKKKHMTEQEGARAETNSRSERRGEIFYRTH